MGSSCCHWRGLFLFITFILRISRGIPLGKCGGAQEWGSLLDDLFGERESEGQIKLLEQAEVEIPHACARSEVGEED